MEDCIQHSKRHDILNSSSAVYHTPVNDVSHDTLNQLAERNYDWKTWTTPLFSVLIIIISPAASQQFSSALNSYSHHYLFEN